MEEAAFDELVLQWVEKIQGISREERCRVLERTCDYLKLQNSDGSLAQKARDLLHTVQAAADVKALRQVAASLVEECTAATLEERLVPYCTLTLRSGLNTLLRIATARDVADRLAAQNASARGDWKQRGESQTWCITGNQRGVGVRTIFTDDGEEVVVSFHDEIVFDVCGNVCEIERTVFIAASPNADSVLTALRLVNSSSV